MSFFEDDKIPHDTVILRIVHPLYIRDDGEGNISVSPYAYQPRLPDKDHDGVSISCEILFANINQIKNWCFSGSSVYKTNSSIPLNRGYDCIHESTKSNSKHCLITGDVHKLVEDIETLNELAETSIFVIKGKPKIKQN